MTYLRIYTFKRTIKVRNREAVAEKLLTAG